MPDEHDLTTREGLQTWTDEEMAGFAATARRARELADQLLENGHARDAQAAATTAGICFDKVRLAAGLATSRSEHLSPDGATAALLAKFEELRARQASAIDVPTSRPAAPALPRGES